MDKLKHARRSLGLTQAKVAERLGYSANTVARWERGELKIPALVAQQLESWTSSKSARLVAPSLPTVDEFHTEIVKRLQGKLDPDLFEACAVELLRVEWPGLAPVSGGSDDGYDGAIPGGPGQKTWPLISTTHTSPITNLRGSLKQAKKKGHAPKRAVFATSRVLTASRRTNLEQAAQKQGVALQQIYDGTWFANALYRSPHWARRLLNVTGAPAALSRLPPSPRVSLSSEVLGRAAEIDALSSASGDIVLEGGPGTGKTTLLRQIVEDGFFLWGSDETVIANAIRHNSPQLIIVDDVHHSIAQLKTLERLRRQLGVDFRIAAGAWPGYRSEIQEVLPNATFVELLPLEADVVAEIVKVVGQNLTNLAVRHIVWQAEGRPGLAATLAELTLKGRFRDVVTGEALLEQLKRYTGNELTMLACFALGGDHGIQNEEVAAFLGTTLDRVSESLTHLAAAGIIRVGPVRSVSVWPEQLRHVLVRDVFFGPGTLLDYEQLWQRVPIKSSALKVLMGATRSGAEVPHLSHLVGQANSDELWKEFAWLDPLSAKFVLDRHPTLLSKISGPLLHHLPDRVIPALLDLEIAAKTNQAANAEPLEPLKHWLRGSSKDGDEMVRRSTLAIESIISWFEKTGNADVALAALCAAVSPNFEYNESDPGSARKVTFTHGVLGPVGLQELMQLWNDHAPGLLTSQPSNWGPIVRLLRSFPVADPGLALDERSLEARREFESSIAAIVLAQPHAPPAIARGVREYAARQGLPLDVGLTAEVASALDVLFPPYRWSEDREERDIENQRDVARVREWARKETQENTPEQIAVRLKKLILQSKQADLHAADYVWVAMEELAAGTESPLDWIRALIDHGHEANLVRPFTRRAIATGTSAAELAAVLQAPRYLSGMAEVIVTQDEASVESIAWLMANAEAHALAIEGYCRVGSVSNELIKRLLQHDSRKVRATIALAYASGSQDAVPSELRDVWRAALLDTALEEEIVRHQEYWLPKLLQRSPEIAAQWLSRFLSGKAGGRYSSIEMAEEVVTHLPERYRSDLLSSEQFQRKHAEVLNLLVAGKPHLYEIVLARPELSDLHLAPLRPSPGIRRLTGDSPSIRGNWPDLASMALSRGLQEEDVFDAIQPRSFGWMGSAVPMWERHRDAFGKIKDHASLPIQRLASRGIDYMQRRADEARQKERLEAVRGIR